MTCADRVFSSTAIAIVLFACALRFIGLEQSPPGFHSDESVGSIHVLCLAETGRDAWGERRLFAKMVDVDIGLSTPVYLYTGVLWTKLFGSSISSFRSIAAFYNVMTVLALYLLMLTLFGRSAALLTALAGALSPWSFQFSRIAWDPPLMPCFLVWGLYFLLRSNKLRDSVVSGALFSAAVYSYPPARVQIPLLFVPLLFFKKGYHGLDRRALTAFFLTGLVLSLPLLPYLLSGEFQARFNRMSVFSPSDDVVFPIDLLEFLWIVFQEFVRNLLAHFSPDFLFFSGDKNLRHSTSFVGQLGWLDVFALLLGAALLARAKIAPKRPEPGEPEAPRRLRSFMVFVILALLAGFVPSAMTTEALPHALRSIGAWPFVSMLTGLILWRAQVHWRLAFPGALVVSVVFMCCFYPFYFGRYPELSRPSFHAAIRGAAERAGARGDWSEFLSLAKGHPRIAFRYFLVHYGGESCRSSEELLVGFE